MGKIARPALLVRAEEDCADRRISPLGKPIKVPAIGLRKDRTKTAAQ